MCGIGRAIFWRARLRGPILAYCGVELLALDQLVNLNHVGAVDHIGLVEGSTAPPPHSMPPVVGVSATVPLSDGGVNLPSSR